MILQWTKVNDQYQATWDGTKLVLAQNPETKRWHLTADEKTRVRESWTTLHKAKTFIDLRAERHLMRRAKALREQGSRGEAA